MGIFLSLKVLKNEISKRNAHLEKKKYCMPQFTKRRATQVHLGVSILSKRLPFRQMVTQWPSEPSDCSHSAFLQAGPEHAPPESKQPTGELERAVPGDSSSGSPKFSKFHRVRRLIRKPELTGSSVTRSPFITEKPPARSSQRKTAHESRGARLGPPQVWRPRLTVLPTPGHGAGHGALPAGKPPRCLASLTGTLHTGWTRSRLPLRSGSRAPPPSHLVSRSYQLSSGGRGEGCQE